MKSLSLFGQIQKLINEHVLATSQRNRLNLNDKALFSEDLFGRVISVLTGKNFINVNEDISNVESIDLFDEQNKSVLQITTIRSGFKKKKDDTIKGFLKERKYNDYVSLQLLFLGPNDVPAIHLKKQRLRDGCFYEGIDTTKLLGKIKSVAAPVKQKILTLLREEEDDPVIPAKPLFSDINEFKRLLETGLEQFIRLKYRSNTRKPQLPLFTERQVKRHNPEIVFGEAELNTTELHRVKHLEVVVGEFASLLRATQPTFLFGELGSGKSTILARYLLEENRLSGSINLLIPANFIKGKVGESPDSVLRLISDHLKNQLIISADIDVRQLFKTYLVTVAFDGLDELRVGEAELLIKHLLTIDQLYAGVTIIATGRPIELKPVIQLDDWNCLSVIDLSLSEIGELLINEARSGGMDEEDAKVDADRRLSFLKLRPDLLTLAVTPLVVTLIRDHLTIDSSDLSLGDLLYKVLKERLSWDEKDLPEGTNAFFNEYRQVGQREQFLAEIARAIAESADQTISEEKLFRLADKFVGPAVTGRSKVVSDALEFTKKAFLQQMENDYSFVSQPLFDTCVGIYIADRYAEIQADNEYIDHHWRAVSGAAAIIRARGETNQALNWFREILKNYLTVPDHTTVAAIIVQELNNASLAELYIELVDQLGYRPLRVWSKQNNDWDDPDTFSPVAIAYTLSIAGAKGFDWFFNAYLSLRDYIHMNETGLNANILLHYLVKNKFCLDAGNVEQLRSLVPYHLRFATFSCSNFVPVLALVIPESLPLHERAVSLLMMLTKYPAYDRARALLDGLCADGHQDIVVDAIESILGENQYQKPEIVSLWFELNHSGPINLRILTVTVKLLLGAELSLSRLLFARIEQDNFVRLLKYMALEHGEHADEAAILLFDLTGETDFYLVGRPIMLASKWHHGSDHRRRKIMEAVIQNDPVAVYRKIAGNLIVRKEETPLLGFFYFIKALLQLEEPHAHWFKQALSFLPKYALMRNPELRDNLRQLLTTKPVYRRALADAAMHLDSGSRENALKITIACLPDDCAAELETYLLGLLNVHAMDEDEWTAFLYKLNFSREILVQLHLKIDQFYVIGKTLCLALLYHHGHALTDPEKLEMVKGLIGPGSLLDRADRDGQRKRLIEDERLLPILLQLLHSSSSDEYDNVSSVLQSYYMEDISLADQLYVFVLQMERHHFYLFDFDQKFLSRLADPAVSAEFFAACKKVGELLQVDKSVAEIFYDAVNGDEKAWLALFEKMLYEREHYQEYVLYHFYRWAMINRRIKPDVIRMAGKVLAEMLDFPAISQHHNRNSPTVHLLVAADEFYGVPREKFIEVLARHEAKEDLLAVAAYRLGEIPENIRSRKDASFIYIFKQNNSKTLPRLTIEQARQWLFKTDQVPPDFDVFMKSVILYDTYRSEDLSGVPNMGLGHFVTAVLQFLHGGTSDFKILIDSLEAVEQLRSGKYFEELIYLLKEISLERPGGRQQYIAGLEKKITTNKRIFLAELSSFFTELFALGEPISFELLKILLDEIMDRAYLLDTHLLNQLAYYTAEILPKNQYEELSGYLLLRIRALINHNLAHRDDFLQVCWLFSLMYLFINQNNEPTVQLGFLTGLKSIFIQNSKRAYRSGEHHLAQFKGRELLLHSEVLMHRIPASVIEEILKFGLTVPMPDIKILCRFFLAFDSDRRVSY